MSAKTKKTKPSNSWKQPLLISGGVLAVFGLLNLLIWLGYLGRAYPGVKLGTISVGNQTEQAVMVRAADDLRDYKLQLTVQDQVKEVSLADMGLQYDLKASAKQAINQGKNNWLPLYGLVYTWRNGDTKLKYMVDQTKLTELSTQLAGTAAVAPTDAKVIIENDVVRVEPDKDGQGIDAKKLMNLMLSSASEGRRSAVMNQGPTKAQVSEQAAQEAAEQVRAIMKQPITVTVSDKSFVPTAADIGKWITTTPDKNGKLVVTTNQLGVAAYVASLASQLDIAAVNKQINMVNGSVTTISQGKDGSSLDQTALASQLSAAVIQNKSQTITGVMKPVAFKTRTNSSVDINGKYIEINLSRQRLWAYQDKQLVYESPITSGATGAGFPTVQGLFSIKAKQTNRNLNGYGIGYDYNVFVQYWMPFSGNYGLHDASWRTSFGGQDYYRGGSHGCVNLPLPTATWLYNWALVGTPVWVHS